MSSTNLTVSGFRYEPNKEGFVLPAESLFPSGAITDPTAGNQAGIYLRVSTLKLNSPTTQSLLVLTRKVKPKMHSRFLFELKLKVMISSKTLEIRF